MSTTRRHGDRHKNRGPEYYASLPPRKKRKLQKQLSKWQRRKVVAWDGEGANLEDGTHIYNLLANSEGTRIFNPVGLGTAEAFDFFLTYGDPRAINVIFGGTYDVNMILVDLPLEALGKLWTEGDCFWGNYRIFYSPRKKLTVQKFLPTSSGKYNRVSFTLWDVFGYFQASFVTACRKWLGNLPILDDIERMKWERSVFSPDRIDEIVAYNAKECDLLVLLVQALFAALDVAGITLQRYDGAGSIAAALFKQWSVVKHKGSPPAEALYYARIAYSGGRIEAPMMGNYESNASSTYRIHRYDINSAYPSVMVNLPSYKDAVWHKDNTWDGSDNSMVHVRWEIDELRPFYPLFYRQEDGTILYPRWGEGVYWGSELKNLLEHGQHIDILDAINVDLGCEDRPFSLIQDNYVIRQTFKQQGSMAHEALKLGLNSLYGKLAQQAGYRNGRIPLYHQLLWAGQVTAGTRRKLYLAAMQKPESVIAFATDAVMCTDSLDLPVSTDLGDWTYDSFDGITLVQPGVYWLKHSNHTDKCPPDCDGWSEKYRGFDKGSLMRNGIVECWRLGQDFQASLTRFVGLGSALMTTDFRGHWRHWETDARVLSLQASGKRQPGFDTLYYDHLCATIPTVNISDKISTPYPLLWEGGRYNKIDDKALDIEELEREYMDSYA